MHDDDPDQDHGKVVFRLAVLLSVGRVAIAVVVVAAVGVGVDGHDGGVVGVSSALVPHGVCLSDA